MVAMQIAREPLVRHVLRQTFQERAKINIKPTKKGKKVRASRQHRINKLLSANESTDMLLGSFIHLLIYSFCVVGWGKFSV